jgi:TLR4 regulator and MIR-interacting MSAP
VSELRVAELLDDLCEDMTSWTWGRECRECTEYKWVPRNSDGGNTAEAVTPQAEMRTRKRELKNYCYSAVERAEDGLAKYLSSEQPHHEGASSTTDHSH